jgi:hypothetical protein
MNRKTLALSMLIPFAAATAVATAPAASAAKTPATKAAGRCTAASHWTMKAKPDNGRMELELEIDSNRNGQRWAVRITDNRVLVYAATRVTVAPSGSFTVRKLAANRAGVDHFVAVARNTSTGETCVARVAR